MAVLATFGKLEASEPRVLPNWLTTCWAMNCGSGIRWPVVASIDSRASGAVARKFEVWLDVLVADPVDGLVDRRQEPVGA